MSECRPDQEAAMLYWQRLEPFFPKGWALAGFTEFSSAIFTNEKEVCHLTNIHAEVIRSAWYIGRMDSEVKL